MSIAVEYDVHPRRISGARYGCVTVGEHAPATCGNVAPASARGGAADTAAADAAAAARTAARAARAAAAAARAAVRVLRAEPPDRVEIGELDGPLALVCVGRTAQQHILGLDVAVGDALPVAVGEGEERLPEDLAHLGQRQRGELEPLLEGHPRVLVKEAEGVAIRLEVDEDERDDVRVVELLKARDRAQEAIAHALAPVHVVELHLAAHEVRLQRSQLGGGWVGQEGGRGDGTRRRQTSGQVTAAAGVASAAATRCGCSDTDGSPAAISPQGPRAVARKGCGCGDAHFGQ